MIANHCYETKTLQDALIKASKAEAGTAQRQVTPGHDDLHPTVTINTIIQCMLFINSANPPSSAVF